MFRLVCIKITPCRHVEVMVKRAFEASIKFRIFGQLLAVRCMHQANSCSKLCVALVSGWLYISTFYLSFLLGYCGERAGLHQETIVCDNMASPQSR